MTLQAPMNRALGKIASFKRLPAGWHYGNGNAPHSDVVTRAIIIAQMLTGSHGFRVTDAFPGIDGEIMVTAYEQEHVFEITAELDGRYRFSHERNDSDLVYKENCSLVDIALLLTEELRKVEECSCTLLESSTQGTITISIPEDSKTLLFGLKRAQMEFLAYRASRFPAPALSQIASADTSQKSIPTSRPIRQSTGFSTNREFHLEAA